MIWLRLDKSTQELRRLVCKGKEEDEGEDGDEDGVGGT